LIIIAEKKHLLGGSPPVDYSHIAKWAVILERWPELASALTIDPSKLVTLESADSPDELSAHISPMVPDWTASQDLLPLLKLQPLLGPVAERLIYFQSSTPQESTETKPEDDGDAETHPTLVDASAPVMAVSDWRDEDQQL
jgi:hypothetical protein